jgi:predicted PurR-regulated permease PerM
MSRILKPLGTILLIMLIGYLTLKFSFLMIYILLAAVISFISQPVVHFSDSARIRKLEIPHNMSVILTLIILFLDFLSLFTIEII